MSVSMRSPGKFKSWRKWVSCNGLLCWSKSKKRSCSCRVGQNLYDNHYREFGHTALSHICSTSLPQV